MARKSYLRVAGVIENMSAFTCEHGTDYALFGRVAAQTLADDAGIPLLGQVPDRAGGRRPAATRGEPIALGAGPAAEAFRAIADRIVDEAVPPDRDGRLQRPHAPGRRRRARRGRAATAACYCPLIEKCW